MLKTKELDQFKELLLSMQSRLMGDIRNLSASALGISSDSKSPTHMAELGTENYEQDFSLRIMENDQNAIREIVAAIDRIEEGEYGICEGCVEAGRPPSKCWIPKTRLKHIPHARNCVSCAETLERMYR